MPIVGVRCGMDDSMQSFQHCIDCHENRSKERNCQVPVPVLKSGRDNHLHRKGAGISITTVSSCPRAYAYEQVFDLYEPVISLWNKGRGTFVHAMMEIDRDPPSWIIREQRLYMPMGDHRITGKPDEIDVRFKVLVDYKSKDNLPLKLDESHEFQFNAYAWLLRNGFWADDDESPLKRFKAHDKANINVETIAAHYVTWKTKKDKAWRKTKYPVWDDDYTTGLITKRMDPLIQWKEHATLPECDPYIPAKHWDCDCVKWSKQLMERGISFQEQMDTFKEYAESI